MARQPMGDVLVVVPGIGGSSLERDGRPIWGGLGVASALVNPEAALGLRGDGFAPERDVVATGVVGRLAQLPGLSKIDAYDRLVDQLEARFELDATNYVVFAYDWRLSCTVNARLLAERICPVLRARRGTDPDARFVFVCHSMGGLVVQQFADVLGGAADTKEVVTLGVPFRGAVKALGVLSRGWPPWLPVIRSRFRRLFRTLPAVHELLPRYRAIVEGSQCRVMAKGDLDGDDRSLELFERACAFHDGLDVAGPRPYGRTVVVGSLQPTPQFATRRQGQLHVFDRWEHDGAVLDERGDGTVPRQSVTPPEWPDGRHAMPLPQSHVGLPTADSVLRVLYNVLTATPRAEQADERAKLAIAVPDLVPAGTDVEIGCEVVEGDPAVPLLVRVEGVDGVAPPRLASPRLRDGELTASIGGLAPGDYRVTLETATTMPDVRAVWDALTVVDPMLEGS